MLPRLDTSIPTSGELLAGGSEWRPVPRSLGVGQRSRDALQRYPRVVVTDLGFLRWNPRATKPPLEGIPSHDLPQVSDMILGILGHVSLASAVSWLPAIIPDSLS